MSSTLRLSGINSGYDTEAMIEELMSSYQTKIDNQSKKLTTLTWQQEAYRDIIDKITTFKDKYFDILNKDSYLMSSTAFNKFSSTVTNKASGESAVGLNVTTSTSSQVGSYKVKLTQLATAATATGTSVTPSNFNLDLTTAAENSTYTENEDGTRSYSFSLDVKVGSVTKTVEFTADNVAVTDGSVDMDDFTDKVTESLNDALASSFGRTGADTDGDENIDDYFLQVSDNGDGTLGFTVNGNASVYIYEKEGNFGLTNLSDSVTIAAQSAVTGTNTLAVNVGGTIKNVSFEGVSSTYFDSRTDSGNSEILAQYNALKEAAYRKENNLSSTTAVSSSDLDDYTYTSTQAAKDYNSAALETALNESFSSEGVTFSVSDGTVTATQNGSTAQISLTSIEGGTLGIEKGSASNRFSTSTKLSDVGIIGNDIVIDGTTGTATKNYSFEINGVKIELDEDATVNDLLTAVNDSGAGVTMTYSTLTNSFSITADDLGSAGSIVFGTNSDGSDNRILTELGLVGDGATVTDGQNAIFTINDVEVYHNSNSYTTDGTTFTFTDDMTVGETYNVSISKSYDDIKQVIKDFVEDYNQLIDDVYEYIGTSPARDSDDNLYEPLTDAEKEEMDDDEIEKWETLAKQGVIYNDSTVSSIMSQLRTALYNTVTLDDGTKFGIFSMGIKTASILESSSTDAMRGKLVLDEDAFDEAFESNADAIEKLFTDSDSGIMSKVNTILTNSVKTTGSTRGTLVNKAGVANTSSATDNYIYRQMLTIQDRISQLQDRYDAKEDYWWTIFTNLETAMSDFNSQSSYLSSYLGS